MQTILGSGGAIGTELANSLTKYTKKVRLVSRNPIRVSNDNELFPADLTKLNEVNKAIEGSEVAYLTVGLKYDLKVWNNFWPIVMRNVIDACKQHNVKLVFFDNIYMYDPDYLNGMNEETPNNPCSRKGHIRKQIADMLMQEVQNKNIEALIARSADFYGPSINNSVLIETVFKKFAQGKRAIWLASVNHKHSYTYTPDAAIATALLGNTDKAYNQIWHLPTAKNPLTGKEWMETIASEMKVKPKYMIASRFLMRLYGLFDSTMSEVVEMMYQYDRDYVFDSSKFEKEFNFTPTPYIEGIKQIVDSDY